MNYPAASGGVVNPSYVIKRNLFIIEDQIYKKAEPNKLPCLRHLNCVNFIQGGVAAMASPLSDAKQDLWDLFP
jgi:hypothetical protein